MTGAHTWKRFVPGNGQDHWDTPPDHWCAWDGGVVGKNGARTPQVFVMIRCPLCKEMGTLPHRIDPQGGVHPSIVCPGKGCALHTMPNTLEGWDRGERPDTKEQA